MAIEHDYFGVLSSGPDGAIFWTERVDFGDQSVTVDLTAPDQDDVSMAALDVAAALIAGIEDLDATVRGAMLTEVDDRTSEVTEYILQQQEAFGEDLEDVLVDVSGDAAVDIIRSLRLSSMTILADEHGGSEPFAVLEYALDADETDEVLLVNLASDGSVQSVTSADLSNAAFPFRTAREIDVGFARVLCIRITYLGELGYELYVPAEQATHVHDRLVAAGEAFGLRHAGLKALASLRMEKGYRDYGHDIDNTDTVLEAGLGFAVALDKPGGFLGRDAVLAQKAAGPLRKRLVQVLVKDPEPLMFHAEVVKRDGRAVGYVRAASYGHTLGGAVGLAMVEADVPVDAEWIARGAWSVDIAGRDYPAVASLRPPYDPQMARIRA